MRIYSNTILSWPSVLHTFQAARIYPGQWYHCYFYKIQTINPLILTTNSPIELLQENCKYYCYNKYHRDKCIEQYGNTFVSVNIHNKQLGLGEETWIYIPKYAEVDDVIAICNDVALECPSALKPSFTLPSLALQ